MTLRSCVVTEIITEFVISDYRVLLELEKPNKIIVYAILPRKKAYKK